MERPRSDAGKNPQFDYMRAIRRYCKWIAEPAFVIVVLVLKDVLASHCHHLCLKALNKRNFLLLE